MAEYTDDEFADLYAQQFEKVRGLHLTLGQHTPDSDWEVRDWSTGAEVLVARFDTEEMAFWFIQAYENAPRVNDLIRASMDAAERAEVEKDDVIASIVNGDFDYIVEGVQL